MERDRFHHRANRAILNRCLRQMEWIAFRRCQSLSIIYKRQLISIQCWWLTLGETNFSLSDCLASFTDGSFTLSLLSMWKKKKKCVDGLLQKCLILRVMFAQHILQNEVGWRTIPCSVSLLRYYAVAYLWTNSHRARTTDLELLVVLV